MTARPVVRSVTEARSKAIAKEGRHIAKSEENLARHLLRDRDITAAGRNARSAARLAASLERTYLELLQARELAKARR